MKLSELIRDAQAVLAAEGDLDVLGQDFYPLANLSVEEADGLPTDFDMPDGMKYVRLEVAD